MLTTALSPVTACGADRLLQIETIVTASPFRRAVPATPRPPPPHAGYVRPKHYAWAALLERTFAVDVLACPDCGGRLRFIATIEDEAVIEKILRHLGLPIVPPAPAPARLPVWLPGFD